MGPEGAGVILLEQLHSTPDKQAAANAAFWARLTGRASNIPGSWAAFSVWGRHWIRQNSGLHSPWRELRKLFVVIYLSRCHRSSVGRAAVL
jgi:hypothetical protein